MFVYVGTYTEPSMGDGKGIYVFQFDQETGALTPAQELEGVANPSFLGLNADRSLLFATEELESGGLSSFARDSVTGRLTPINSQPSHGAHPCFVTTDPSDRFILASNYNGGTVVAVPVAPDGRLGPATSVVAHHGSSINPDRQREAHPHMIAPTPDGNYVIATDLGTDEIVIYRLKSDDGTLVRDDQVPASVKTAPGAGPRHFAFSPGGHMLYVINELDSTIASYTYADGQIRPLETVSTLPADFTGDSTCAQIVVSPDGRFVYGSNRGHDSIAIFAVDETGGVLTLVDIQSTQGKEPRNFNIDPTGNWLLAGNQHSGTVATFRRDQLTGKLEATGPLTNVPSPVAILFA